MALGKFDDFVAFLIRKADSALAKVTHNSVIAQILAKSGTVANFDNTLHSLEALSEALRQRGGGGLIAQVDSISGNTFVAAELIGWGDDAFPGWMVYVFQADNAAPEGEYRGVTDFVSATGTVSHEAFTAALAAGDYVMLIPPSFDAARQMRGGAQTIQDIIDALQAELDFARIQTLASPVTLDGTLQTVYSNTQGRPFFFAGYMFSWDSGAWAGGESVTINVDAKADGSNWENLWTKTLAAAASPLTVAVPSGDDEDASLNIPIGFWSFCDIRVTIQQTVEGAGYHVVSHCGGDGVPGN